MPPGAAQRQKKKERKRKLNLGSSHHGSAEMNLTSIHKKAGSIPGLAQWVKDPGQHRSQVQLGSSVAVAMT